MDYLVAGFCLHDAVAQKRGGGWSHDLLEECGSARFVDVSNLIFSTFITHEVFMFFINELEVYRIHSYDRLNVDVWLIA